MDKKLMALLATTAPTAAQLRGLTAEQLRGLTAAQLSWLTAEQLSWLTAEQLRIINLEGVPLVANLYTRILEQIQSESLSLDQSTFGESNRGQSVCGSPMCVGGTTVWLAGDKGYELSDKYGFALAAALIHRKSRPDVSQPRYDSYPSEWALAYIEARAAEETQKET